MLMMYPPGTALMKGASYTIQPKANNSLQRPHKRLRKTHIFKRQSIPEQWCYLLVGEAGNAAANFT